MNALYHYTPHLPLSIFVDGIWIYQRALQAGATSLGEPEDKPYQERNAGFKDSFGNVWGISTYIGSN